MSTRLYRARLVTEDLPDGDHESWVVSLKEILGGMSSKWIFLKSIGFDESRRRATVTIDILAGTGSGAIERLNTVVRAIGDHPELVAIRRLHVYPVDDQNDVLLEARVDLEDNLHENLIDLLTAKDWQLIEQALAEDAMGDRMDD